MIRSMTSPVSTLALAATLVFATGTASGELIYAMEPHTLPEGVGGEIFGGTLTLTNNAEADGVLTISDILAWEVNHSDTTFDGDQSDVEIATGTFSNDQLLGGSLFLRESGLSDAFIDYGGGDLITVTADSVSFFWTEVTPPFVIANRVGIIPEPGTAGVCVMIMMAVLGRRRRCDTA